MQPRGELDGGRGGGAGRAPPRATPAAEPLYDFGAATGDEGNFNGGHGDDESSFSPPGSSNSEAGDGVPERAAVDGAGCAHAARAKAEVSVSLLSSTPALGAAFIGGNRQTHDASQKQQTLAASVTSEGLKAVVIAGILAHRKKYLLSQRLCFDAAQVRSTAQRPLGTCQFLPCPWLTRRLGFRSMVSSCC